MWHIHYHRLFLGMSVTNRHGGNDSVWSHRSATSQGELFCLLGIKTVVSMSITDGKPANRAVVSVPFSLGTSVQPYVPRMEVGRPL